MSAVTGSQSDPNPKLPLWHTISLAYSTYFGNFPDVLRTSWLWLVLIAPLAGISSWLQWSLMARVMADMRPGMPPKAFLDQASRPVETMLLGNAANLALILGGVSVAVAWHRRIILGEHPGFSGGNLVTKNLWHYVGIGLAILLIAVLPAAAIVLPMFIWLFHQATFGAPSPLGPQSAVLIPVIFLVYLAAFAVMLRLSLLLPARAVGNLDLTIKETWRRTRGNTWRMFWGVFACTLPPALAAQIAFLVFVGFPSPATFAIKGLAERMTITSTVLMVYYLLITPIGIGFLSHAYRHFFNVRESSAGDPVAPGGQV